VLHFTILTINTLYTVFIGHTLPDLYSGLLRNPDIEKAKADFKRAQKVEERFHKDFAGIDFT